MTPPHPWHPTWMLTTTTCSHLSEGIKNTQMNFPYDTESISQRVHHFKPIQIFGKKIIIFFQKNFIGLKWCTCCEMDSVWYGKFIWVFFDTFTKVRTCGCGQHPGRMSRVGVLYFMYQSILNIFWAFYNINHFHGWGVLPPPPFAETSAKIINLIFEPFPNLIGSR